MYDKDCDECLIDWHYCPAENDVVGHYHNSEDCIGFPDEDEDEDDDLILGEWLMY